MKRLVLATCLISAAHAASAQAPFDMSPERPAPPPLEAPQVLPQRPITPTPQPQEPAVEVPAADTVPPDDAALLLRHIIPDARLALSGEVASRRWAVHMTEREAGSSARLQIAYQNAVVVAPEWSMLTVRLNGTPVLSEPISSVDGFKRVEAQLPAGSLRPGRNEISVESVQRHRTDCSIESTYELWTEIDAQETFLAFEDAEARKFSALADLAALAPDGNGTVKVRIVAPSARQSGSEDPLMRLSQAIALHAAMPDFDFSIVTTDDEVDEDGTALVVLVGTRQEFAGMSELADIPDQGAFVGFLDHGDDEAYLAVIGDTREQWSSALDRLIAPVDRAAGSPRDALITQFWQAPNAPMFYGARTMSFGELGVASEQFAGRRYTRSFALAVPSDFYAGSYGQARIELDAAYSDAILPGSLINVYVNGNIATSVPITSRRGQVLNDFPIDVTLRHFHPGMNDIDIEVALMTEQDAACLPGAAGDASPRLAIFDTSRFVMPRFARVAQRPNLSALSGTAFPYSYSQEAVPVIIERSDLPRLSATANLAARMAISAGRVIPFTFNASIDSIRGRDALFIAPAGGLPSSVLTQVGVEPAPGGWTSVTGAANQGISVERWREEMGAGGIRARYQRFQAWLQSTFNITVDMLRFAPGAEPVFVPPVETGLVIAQGLNPDRNGVWTVVASASEGDLENAVESASDLRNWQQLSGHISTIGSDLSTVASVPVNASEFQETQPPSFANYRLIAANWLSTNILSYSLILVVICVLLGIATSALLSLTGRRR